MNYIVWNNNKTEGFVTRDKQLAYEARKGSETNCYYPDGTESKLAKSFCELISGEEDCTIEEVPISEHKTNPTVVKLTQLIMPIENYNKYKDALEVGSIYTVVSGQPMSKDASLLDKVIIPLEYVVGEGTVLAEGKVELELTLEGHHHELLKRSLIKVGVRAIVNNESNKAIKIICFDLLSK